MLEIFINLMLPFETYLFLWYLNKNIIYILYWFIYNMCVIQTPNSPRMFFELTTTIFSERRRKRGRVTGSVGSFWWKSSTFSEQIWWSLWVIRVISCFSGMESMENMDIFGMENEKSETNINQPFFILHLLWKKQWQNKDQQGGKHPSETISAGPHQEVTLPFDVSRPDSTNDAEVSGHFSLYTVWIWMVFVIVNHYSDIQLQYISASVKTAFMFVNCSILRPVFPSPKIQGSTLCHESISSVGSELLGWIFSVSSRLIACGSFKVICCLRKSFETLQ